MIILNTNYRWSSFGAGMVAYGAMSSLARAGHHGGYYNGYNSYPHHRPSIYFFSVLNT